MTDLNKLIMITDYKEMTREELEVLTDQLRVERNSLVLELEKAIEELDWEKVNKKAKYPKAIDEQEDLEEPLGGPVLG
jgi:hypothetical protein